MKVLHSICQHIWKTQQWPQDWKRSVFIPIPKKGNAKEYSNYCTIALISHASQVMLKILQARLQQYVNRELPDVQAGFRKGRGTRDQNANISWIIEKAREFQKNKKGLRGSGAGTLGVPLEGTRRVGGLLGVAGRLSGTVSPFMLKLKLQYFGHLK